MGDIFQWAGCVTGILGSLLLALNNRHSGWGFVLFLVSNGFWFAFGMLTHASGLSAMQVFYTATSVVGIYRWFFARTAKVCAQSAC